MSKVSFDGVNKLITINTGVTSLDVRNDVYLEWKSWAILNPMYWAAFRAVGGDKTGTYQNAPEYYFLTNGWQIVATDVNVTINENLYSDDYDNPFIITNSSIISKNSDIPRIDSIGNSLTGITESLKLILGLVQQNYRLSEQIYDSEGRLLSVKIKLYNTKEDCDAETNYFASYSMTAAYDTNGLLYDYKVVRD